LGFRENERQRRLRRRKIGEQRRVIVERLSRCCGVYRAETRERGIFRSAQLDVGDKLLRSSFRVGDALL